MIVLIEPPREVGTTSGGYRYQSSVFDHFSPDQGRIITATAGELHGVVDSLRRQNPDVVIVVDGLFAELSSRPLPGQCIALLHMIPARSDWCEEPVHVVATSSSTACVVASRSLSTTVVRPGIDHCFDQPRVARNPGEAIQIVCVGTVSKGKGQVRLVRILQAISVPWRLTLIGSHGCQNPELTRLREVSAGLPVELLGAIPIQQVAMHFARADLMVSMSKSESFGMAVAEAAAAGLPVVALATGEIESFITHGESGWLLPREASDAQVEECLHSLLSAPGKLDAAKLARLRPSLADWSDVAHRFLQACVATQS